MVASGKLIEVFWIEGSVGVGVRRGWYWEPAAQMHATPTSMQKTALHGLDDPAPRGPFATSALAWVNFWH